MCLLSRICNVCSYRRHKPRSILKLMYLTKKHLSRRAVLRGAGVAVGLPLLDAMIPAATALGQTAAAPKLRTGFFYIPHGAIMWNTAHGPAMDHWTPSGAGATFKLSHIMEPLEPYKHLVTSFANLENKASANSVHAVNPATWLSGAKPDLAAPGASMTPSMKPRSSSGASSDFNAAPSPTIAARIAA